MAETHIHLATAPKFVTVNGRLFRADLIRAVYTEDKDGKAVGRVDYVDASPLGNLRTESITPEDAQELIKALDPHSNQPDTQPA